MADRSVAGAEISEVQRCTSVGGLPFGGRIRSPSNTSLVTRISCRWQTRATRCITANVLQTNNIDAHCDELATELSWQLTNFQLPHLHLTNPTCIWRLGWGWPGLWFAEIFGTRKLDVLGYRVALFGDPMFSCFSSTPTCDRRTDRRTDTRRQLIPVACYVAFCSVP